MYRLLAGLFAKELTKEKIVSFREGKGRQLLDALETVEAYALIVRRLRVYFTRISNPEQAALDLAESYAWNFHGVGGTHSAPLYASVYLSESGATHQQVERELRGIIRGQGLSSNDSEREPYDHLSVILEFIAWMDEHEDGIEQQADSKEIVERYLLSWLPAFVSQCQRADKQGFYSDLALVTLGFVEADFSQPGLKDIQADKV